MSPMLSSAVGDVDSVRDFCTCSMVVVLHAGRARCQAASMAHAHGSGSCQEGQGGSPVVAQAQVGNEHEALRVGLACGVAS